MDGAKWAFCVESTSKYLGIQSDKTTFLANCNPVTSNAEFIVKNRYIDSDMRGMGCVTCVICVCVW